VRLGHVLSLTREYDPVHGLSCGSAYWRVDGSEVSFSLSRRVTNDVRHRVGAGYLYLVACEKTSDEDGT
jgi:hypothetical protein